MECPFVYFGLYCHREPYTCLFSERILAYASFFKYVKVAMNAAQLAIASWKPVPVALV